MRSVTTLLHPRYARNEQILVRKVARNAPPNHAFFDLAVNETKAYHAFDEDATTEWVSDSLTYDHETGDYRGKPTADSYYEQTIPAGSKSAKPMRMELSSSSDWGARGRPKPPERSNQGLWGAGGGAYRRLCNVQP